MQPPVKQVHFTANAKSQLITLKRRTKIDTYNVLVRWALMASLKESSIPSPIPLEENSNLVITYETIAGQMAETIALIFRQRLHNDNLLDDPQTIATQFKLHCHRGIGYLAGNKDIQSIEDLISLALK